MAVLSKQIKPIATDSTGEDRLIKRVPQISKNFEKVCTVRKICNRES